MDIVANLKALTEAGHYVHLGKVKAHAGVEGNILADAAAKQVVTLKINDAGGDLNDIPNEDLAADSLTVPVMSATMRMSTMSGLCPPSPNMKAWARTLANGGIAQRRDMARWL